MARLTGGFDAARRPVRRQQRPLLRLAVPATLLVALLGGGAWTASRSLHRSRVLAGRIGDTLIAAANVRTELERMVSLERAARLAGDPASLAADDVLLEAAARRAEGALSGPDPAAFPTEEAIGTNLRRLRVELPRSVAALRRLVPGRPVLSDAPRPIADDQAIAAALSVATALEADARAGRIAVRATTTRSVRNVAAIFLLSIGTLVAVLTGLIVRLVQSRTRLIDARRQEALEAARLRGLVASMRDGIAVFDPDETLAFRNDRLVSQSGLDPADCAPGTPFGQFATALLDGVGGDLLSGPVPAEHAPLSASIRVRSRTLEIDRAAMPGGGQLLMIADVSERVETEAIARQAQKMDVLGRLTGGIAHDFNNLLQSLSAHLEIAREPAGVSLDPARLQAMSDGIERGIRLTRHLLAFARRQELRLTTIDLAELLHEMTDLLGRTLGDHVTVRCTVPADLWPVLADRSQLENALLNVALNARDAMPTGGALFITASNRIEMAAAFVRIALRDTGMGMTEDELERATEPFYTTKGDGQGTGLGLSLVDGFARQSGGRLSLTSRKGEGTEAAILLPRTEGLPAGPPPPRSADAMRRGSGELVLLVEDNPAVLDAARSALEFLGYDVRTAADADSAWALLVAGLRPAMLFTDLMMPGELDAAGLIRRARDLLPGLPVLLNTGYLDAPALRDIPLDLRTILLPKPWRLASLSLCLRELLELRDAPRSIAGDDALPV